MKDQKIKAKMRKSVHFTNLRCTHISQKKNNIRKRKKFYI